MDEFAQTRPPDDLFDDDFTPMEQPVVEPEPSRPSIQIRGAAQGPRGGRGAKRGGAGEFVPNAPRAPAASRQATSAPSGADSEPKASNGDSAAAPQAPDAPTDAPQAPARMRERAVQGDRTATGGVKKAKLTEEEMTARLEAMKIKSSELEAAHARSTADAANFEAREAHAAQRRKEDRQNRQQMMSEREKNRQRKLQALGGREWDAEKKEEDFAPANRGARRGAHGGIGGSRYAVEAREADVPDRQEEKGGSRGRGRGRGGRGRGRGGILGAQTKDEPQLPPNASDFPELPGAVRKSEDTSVSPAKLDFPIKSVSEKQLGASMIPSQAQHIKSWADQVEDPLSP